MPIKGAYLSMGMFFVFILNPQNTLLILEECLSLNVMAIPMILSLYNRIKFHGVEL